MQIIGQRTRYDAHIFISPIARDRRRCSTFCAGLVGQLGGSCPHPGGATPDVAGSRLDGLICPDVAGCRIWSAERGVIDVEINRIDGAVHQKYLLLHIFQNFPISNVEKLENILTICQMEETISDYSFKFKVVKIN